MTQRIAGPGLGLPLPQNLYPSELYGAPPDTPSNKIALAPGDTLPIPAGDWFINLGQYCIIQFLDPITNTWSMGPNAAWQGGHKFVVSDGFNVRVANLTGCMVAAVVETSKYTIRLSRGSSDTEAISISASSTATSTRSTS